MPTQSNPLPARLSQATKKQTKRPNSSNTTLQTRESLAQWPRFPERAWNPILRLQHRIPKQCLIQKQGVQCLQTHQRPREAPLRCQHHKVVERGSKPVPDRATAKIRAGQTRFSTPVPTQSNPLPARLSQATGLQTTRPNSSNTNIADPGILGPMASIPGTGLEPHSTASASNPQPAPDQPSHSIPYPKTGCSRLWNT